MVDVIIDYREKSLLDAFKSATAASLPGKLSSANLSAGDIWLVPDNNHDMPFIVIERKTICDLSASVIDGRFKNQKERMKALLLLNSNNSSVTSFHRRIIYIIEGAASDFFHPNCSLPHKIGISHKALQSIVSDLQIVDGFSVFLNSQDDISYTMHLISKIWERACKEFHLYCHGRMDTRTTRDDTTCTNNDVVKNAALYASTLKPKKIDNENDPISCTINQLCIIPRMSPNIAAALINQLNIQNIAELVLHFANTPCENVISIIADTVLQGTIRNKQNNDNNKIIKTRTLGKTLATRIVHLLGLGLHQQQLKPNEPMEL